MAREGEGEPLFGEDWWRHDQQMSQGAPGRGPAVNRPHDLSQPIVTHGAGEPESATRLPMPTDTLISIREIRQLFNIGRTAAYELTHRPDFPEPVPISPRCYRWWAKEVTLFAANLRDKGRNRRKTRGPERAVRQTPPAPSASSLRITGKVRVARGRRETS